MTTADTLQSLLARVEAGTGEDDRETTFELFCLFEADDDDRAAIARGLERQARGELTRADILGWRRFDESEARRALTSLDAAVALCERRFPSVLWGIGLDDAGRPKAGLNFGRINGRFEETYSGQAMSEDDAARALIAALIRAEIAKREAGDARHG